MDGARASLPIWTDDELEEDRLRAIEVFIQRWQLTGTIPWERAFSSLEPQVMELFARSSDLLALQGTLLTNNPAFLPLLRFLSSPPVSEDDLNTLVGINVAKKRKVTIEQAERIIEVITAALDPARLPWVRDKRSPTSEERVVAVKWTTGLLALERLRTDKRMSSSRSQQELVQSTLAQSGLTFIADRTPIADLDNLPRGSFRAETVIAGEKCDFPVRLPDGRLVAIECKVSNSAINSVKRLIHETGGKAQRWRREFGERVLPAAVLGGVFKLHNLKRAQQEYRVNIFWEHDLSPMVSFLAEAQAEVLEDHLRRTKR